MHLHFDCSHLCCVNCRELDSQRSRIFFCFSACRFPAGVESKLIPDSSFTASTVATSPQTFPAHNARLNLVPPWAASVQDQNQWLQIDLGQKSNITGVATQGQWQRWVKTYKISYSDDGSTWTTYQAGGIEKVCAADIGDRTKGSPMKRRDRLFSTM